MDDIARVFFDATFGYSANVFNALTWDEVESYYESPATTYTQSSNTNANNPSFAPSIGGGTVRYAALYQSRYLPFLVKTLYLDAALFPWPAKSSSQ